MSYDGYLLKIGDYKVPENKYIKSDTYKPYVIMQDIDDWTDAHGKLHRNVVDVKALKVEFSTPPMTNTEFETFMSNIRDNYVDKKKREANIKAYVPERNNYVEQRCYLADITPQIHHMEGNKLLYNTISIKFVGGLA